MTYVYPNGTDHQPPYPPSGAYGVPRGPSRKHAGVDFNDVGTIHNITAGKVTQAGWMNADAGNAVAVDIDDHEGYDAITIVYMHCASVKSNLVGKHIATNTIIGEEGDTGNAEGDCVHTEIRFWKNGSYTTTDPVPWLAARINGTPSGGGGGKPPVNKFVSIDSEDEEMARSIITKSSADVKFELGAGSKRSISQAEWAAMRAVEKAGGPTLAVGIVDQATLDGIPGK